ncbi:DUF6461 domain-containing protein [Sphaerisporangium viridialbum]|uniref:DUF6461 domain-containing protein n=1 Tax=Sphaerisporangium viridialbum TaxID=46189 RepID=UPI003C73C074
MIATPDDYAWFSYERFPDLADAYCFTYVRGLTPEQLVTRLGGQLEDFTPMTLEKLTEAASPRLLNRPMVLAFGSGSASQRAYRPPDPQRFAYL